MSKTKEKECSVMERPAPEKAAAQCCAKEKVAVTEAQTDWFIDDLLPKGQKVMIATCEGGGKTTLLAWIALCTAVGNPIFGHKVKGGAVLMIDEETPLQSLEKKIYRYCLGLGYERRRKIPNLKVMSRTDFRFNRKNEKMMDLIKEMQPALITIDSLLACLPSGRQGLGENNAETGIAIRDDLNKMLAVSPKSTILIAAHSKMEVMNFSLRDYRKCEMQALVRGHGSIVGQACDTGLGLKKISENPLRLLVIPKARREAIPTGEIFVEMEEQQYGKGKARLVNIPPVPIPPTRVAIDLFSIFFKNATKAIEASTIRTKAYGLYAPAEIRLGLDQLIDNKVIVTTGDNFTFILNPKERDEANPHYIDQLLGGLKAG